MSIQAMKKALDALLRYSGEDQLASNAETALRQAIEEHESENTALTADGFEDALIGFGVQFNLELAIYDYDKCIQILMERDGMDETEAIEYMDFNVTGAYVGTNTPVFLVEQNQEYTPATSEYTPANTPATSEYTPPRQWVGLTDEEIEKLHHEIKVRLMGTYKTEDIYRAIEAKLKEKNT